MAGPHALETTEQLLAVDETVAEAAGEAASLCDYPETITLAVVLSPRPVDQPHDYRDRALNGAPHAVWHRSGPALTWRDADPDRLVRRSPRLSA
jgi:hypothetical protein